MKLLEFLAFAPLIPASMVICWIGIRGIKKRVNFDHLIANYLMVFSSIFIFLFSIYVIVRGTLLYNKKDVFENTPILNILELPLLYEGSRKNLFKE